MPRVLLVEDNPENRDALSRRLQRRGYEVIIAVDGKQGVAMAQAEAPDVILLDISLPEMDGWEVARTLEASEATRGIPVIPRAEILQEVPEGSVGAREQHRLVPRLGEMHARP